MLVGPVILSHSRAIAHTPAAAEETKVRRCEDGSADASRVAFVRNALGAMRVISRYRDNSISIGLINLHYAVRDRTLHPAPPPHSERERTRFNGVNDDSALEIVSR